MSTQQIIESWENGVEPYRAETPTPIDHTSRNGQATPFRGKKFRKWLFARLVALELEAIRKRSLSTADGKDISESTKQKFPSLLMSAENTRRKERNTQ